LKDHAMKIQRPVRLWVEMALGAASAVLLAITLVWPDWIERVVDFAPDSGDGSVEWGWAAGFAVATLVFLVDAGRTWRRSARAAAASR
jgi:uncharacterized membrane protein